MKKAVVALALLISLPAFAGVKTMNQPSGAKGNWNQITILNHSNTDVAYIMMGMAGGAVYGIPHGEADTYHSGSGDEHARFQTSVCHQMEKTMFGYACKSYDSLTTCAAGYYNADNIKSIVINSPTSCTITCRDGQTCKVG